MAFRLPFSMGELRQLLEKGTVFSRVAQLTIDNFVKYFFPLKDRQGGEDKRGVSDSSSADEQSNVTTGATFSGMMNNSSSNNQTQLQFRRSGSFNN